MPRFMIYCAAIGTFAFNAILYAGSPADFLLEKIRAVAPKGQGHREAIRAMQQLSNARANQLPQILAGMDEAGPLATNWIRAAVETIAQRAADSGTKLPVQQLEAFLADTSHAPCGRRLAYELLLQADASAAERWISMFLDDPSLELRRESVAQAITDAESLAEKDKPFRSRA